MSFNLLDTAKSLFSNELISKASAYLGESENSVNKGISAIIPTVLGGLTDKMGSSAGTTAVIQMVQEQHASGILGSLGNFFGNEGGLLNKGAGLLENLFGHKTEAVTGAVSTFSGLKSSSVTSLLSMAVPAVLGLIGKHTATGGGSVSTLLNAQKDNISAGIPGGLNLSSILGGWTSKVSDIASQAKTAASSTANYTKETVEKAGNGLKWLLPLLLLALLAAAAWYLFGKGCKSSDSTASGNDTVQIDKPNTAIVSAAVGKLDSLTGDWVYDNGEMATIDLPNNSGSLTVGKNSTEYRLVNFLNNKNAVIDTAKGNWFEFTNVHFKKGGAELTDSSMAQLKNMVAIAKAYTSAKFKFGGYTDNTGNDNINVPLSQKRADAVANMIVKMGADKASFVDAKGYGSQWPIATNDTKEGQAQNRRVAVNVKAK